MDKWKRVGNLSVVMNAKVIKVEQADGYVSLTLDVDAASEIESCGQFELTSCFETANGGIEFCIFTDEIFKVGDCFIDGEWIPAETAEKASDKMKSQGLSFMNRELDRINAGK